MPLRLCPRASPYSFMCRGAARAGPARPRARGRLDFLDLAASGSSSTHELCADALAERSSPSCLCASLLRGTCSPARTPWHACLLPLAAILVRVCVCMQAHPLCQRPCGQVFSCAAVAAPERATNSSSAKHNRLRAEEQTRAQRSLTVQRPAHAEPLSVRRARLKVRPARCLPPQPTPTRRSARSASPPTGRRWVSNAICVLLQAGSCGAQGQMCPPVRHVRHGGSQRRVCAPWSAPVQRSWAS